MPCHCLTGQIPIQPCGQFQRIAPSLLTPACRVSKQVGQTTELRTRFADPAVYREGAAALKGLQDQLAAREAELAAAYARWEALEARQVAATANSEN